MRDKDLNGTVQHLDYNAFKVKTLLTALHCAALWETANPDVDGVEWPSAFEILGEITIPVEVDASDIMSMAMAKTDGLTSSGKQKIVDACSALRKEVSKIKHLFEIFEEAALGREEQLSCRSENFDRSPGIEALLDAFSRIAKGSEKVWKACVMLENRGEPEGKSKA